MPHQDWFSILLSPDEVRDALIEKAKALRPDLKTVLDAAVGTGLTSGVDNTSKFEPPAICVAFNVTSDGKAADAEPPQAGSEQTAGLADGSTPPAGAPVAKPPGS